MKYRIEVQNYLVGPEQRWGFRVFVGDNKNPLSSGAGYSIQQLAFDEAEMTINDDQRRRKAEKNFKFIKTTKEVVVDDI